MREKTASAKRATPLYKQSGFRLFLMISPFIIIVFLLSYFPLYGWKYAFYDYKPGIPLTSDQFVGFKNFLLFFQDKYAFQDITRVLRNTIGMSILGIIISPLPLIFAVLLNEIKFNPVKRAVQTLTTIPNFISWVLVYAVAYAMFAVDDGFVNRLLMQLGIIDDGINFLAAGGSTVKVWLTMLGYSIWKTLGWSAIMYFAALASIDREQYEAAKVDGAGRFALMWHITIPGLLPTYFVLLLLSIANFMNNGMEQYFVFQNAMNKSAIEVLDLYVYNQGVLSVQYSFSTAVSILKSLVSVVLLFLSNSISKLFRGESII